MKQPQHTPQCSQSGWVNVGGILACIECRLPKQSPTVRFVGKVYAHTWLAFVSDRGEEIRVRKVRHIYKCDNCGHTIGATCPHAQIASNTAIVNQLHDRKNHD